MHEFPSPGPITVSARVAAGSIEVIAEDRDTATVEVAPYSDNAACREAAADTRVEMRNGRLVIETPDLGGFIIRRSPKVRVDIRVPLDSTLDVRVASADLTGHGRFAEVTMKSASGDAYLEHVTGQVVITTASGDVRLGQVEGSVKFNGASGNLTAQTVRGEVTVHAASGDVEIEQADSSVLATTASGDVRLGSARRGIIKVKSASGDVWVGVPAGTGVWLDLTTMSGNTRSDLSTPAPTAGTGTADLTLEVRTMSGDIDIRRVAAAA